MNGLERYPNLFKPIRLGNTIFRNRIFSAPTGLYDLTPQRVPTDDFIAYFERKAKGGAASVNIGECYVDDVGIPNDDYEVIHLCEHLDNRRPLAKLADAITRNGAVATIELQKPGMASSQSSVDEVLLGPSDGVCEFNHGIRCKAMTEEEILKTIDAFADAAVYAKQRGFGMVMVHAGHGWLLHQFLSPYTNKRTDRWGGSIENRARFTVAVIDEIHKRCGKGFPVEVRMSGAEAFEGGFDVDYGIEIAKQLEGHADLIHVSVGNIFAPNTMHFTHPGIFGEDGCNVKYAAEIKKHVKTPVATIGALSDPDRLEEIIASGKADVVEMARGLICEPDMPNKLRTGRHQESRRCLRCFECVKQDYLNGHLYCAINPESGKDYEIGNAEPVKRHKRVLIAGGGIAGMQAALTASREGHQVILCEKTDALGGIIQCEKNVPFKKRIDEYIAQQRYLLNKEGIEIHLNTELTAENAKKYNADVIIAAVGAKPALPPIPGIDGANVKTAADVFINPELAGEKTVILGAGLTGMELAIYLAQLGKKVDIIEMAPANGGPGESYGYKLLELGLEIQYETKATAISASGVSCRTPDGEKQIDADCVIVAMGMRPLWDEAEALHDCAPEFQMIGDCRAPRNIFAATQEGWTAARNIGRY